MFSCKVLVLRLAADTQQLAAAAAAAFSQAAHQFKTINLSSTKPILLQQVFYIQW
jgi:hypothetical protein